MIKKIELRNFRLFDYKIIETGLKHGTVTVIIDSEMIEITTYRIDKDYEDHRHPGSVVFTPNLKDDLMRRDFTVNAMAYNKKIVDIFAGYAYHIGMMQAVFRLREE